MAGWRLGMLSGNETRINEILRFKSNMDSGMFLPIQHAAITALELDNSWYRSTNAIYATRRELVWELLDVLNCTYDKDQCGLFVWAKISARISDSYALSDLILYNAKVFITPGAIFGSNGTNYIRISLCNNESVLREAITRIKNFIQ